MSERYVCLLWVATVMFGWWTVGLDTCVWFLSTDILAEYYVTLRISPSLPYGRYGLMLRVTNEGTPLLLRKLP